MYLQNHVRALHAFIVYPVGQKSLYITRQYVTDF
jgi:hypothetical protein